MAAAAAVGGGGGGDCDCSRAMVCADFFVTDERDLPASTCHLPTPFNVQSMGLPLLTRQCKKLR